MSRKLIRKEYGFGKLLATSAGLHLVLLLLLTHFQLLGTGSIPLQPTYYVDLASLPTATPGGGSSTPLPPPPAPQSAPEASAPLPAPAKALPASPSSERTSAREFEERMSRLSRKAEEQRLDDSVEALRRRVGSTGAGPAQKGGSGANPLGGSDYGSYIQSRLRDAFTRTIASGSSAPMMVVRLTLDRQGRIIRQRIERSSGDRLFEEAVKRAIALAEESFPPNPSGQEYENGFVFRPEGVGTR